MADALHALVLPVGLAARTVPSRPLVLVSIADDDEPRVIGAYRVHRDGKPARIRVATSHGLDPWSGKILGYLCCHRCQRLH